MGVVYDENGNAVSVPAGEAAAPTDWAPSSLDYFVSSVLGFSAGVSAFPDQQGLSGVNLEERNYSWGSAPTVTAMRSTPVGGQYTPKVQNVNQALGAIMNLPKEEVIAWKNRMYDSGLYDPGYYSKGIKPRQVGVFDSADMGAMQELMYTALRAPEGYTVQSLLGEMEKTSPYSAKNDYGKQRPTASVTTIDPATVRKYAETAAQELLGRKLDDKALQSLVKRMVSSDTGAKVAGAQAQIAASEGGGGVVQQQDVDVATRTEQAVEDENAAEVEAKRFAGGFDTFMKLITGGG